MLKRGTRELEIHVEKMYNHLLERINQVLFHLSLIIGLGFSTLHLIYHLVKQITDSELIAYFSDAFSVMCSSLCKCFHHFFFFLVRLQTNFGCNENICKVWKSNRHWGKNKTSFQSYLTCPPLIFNVSWQVCFHRMVSQGLFFQVYWSFLKASIQRFWKYFVITQMFLKKICKGFFCLFLTYCNDF